MENSNCITKNSLTPSTKGGNNWPQHCVGNECVCWWCVRECVNCHFIWWRRTAQSGKRIEWGRERGRRITLTQITKQPWCRKKEMSPWQRKPPASVMWNWCWSLSRRRAHAVHLHAERPAPHHVATRWVLTAIPSHGGKIRGLSQAQPWHHGLYRSQVWTHTGAQYGNHRVPPWISIAACN